ncbi:hypothetical protein V6S67_18125 [Arthrobacter sp. Soc17.1.1.1]|uniref:hypothetical protein n=1 Tax=Arthrobacter sp. Soc17.1.1.1 TaxID=3121277 RepID=UPI002FE4C18A
MSVDDYLALTGLPREYWRDPKLRVLVQLFLNVHRPASGPTERFLSGTVIMTNPTAANGLDSGGAGHGRENVDMDITSTGIVREVAGELLEAAIIGQITALLLPTRPARAT